jgi:hypothetical protein
VNTNIVRLSLQGRVSYPFFFFTSSLAFVETVHGVKSHSGQFKPRPSAKPSIGLVGEVEYVEEDRVEIVVNDKGQNEEIKNVIKELKSVYLFFSPPSTPYSW